MNLTKNLIESLKNDNLENAEIFLVQGADPNYVFPSEGVAPIHLAAGLGKKALSLFIEHGGNPNIKSIEGSTPLHVAATWGDDECVKLLLQCGADPLIKDQDGYQPVDVAKVYGHEDVYVYLKYYSLLLLSDNHDFISEKYTRMRISEDDNQIRTDDSKFDSSYDSDEASQLFDDCITSRNYNHLYINKLNHQLYHHTRCGQPISIDVTSPDHPYMDYKQTYRQTNCLSPVSSNSLEDSFILYDNTSAVTNPYHRTSSNVRDNGCQYKFMSEPLKSPDQFNKSKYLITSSSMNDIQKDEATLRRGTSPLPEFQKNFKQNNTIQWVSEHADMYNRTNNSKLEETDDVLRSQNREHLPITVLNRCHPHSNQTPTLKKFYSVGCNLPQLSRKTVPNCYSSIHCSADQPACNSYHPEIHQSYGNQGERNYQQEHHHHPSSPKPNQDVKHYMQCHADKPLDTAIPAPSSLQHSESESDSTLSQNSQKSSNSQYSKRKFVKSTDNNIVARRCRDRQDQFNKLSQINGSHNVPEPTDQRSFNFEACIDSEISSDVSHHMISGCVPIHSESKNISTLTDIVSQNRAAYTERLLENKQKWPTQQSLLYSGEVPFTPENDNTNVNNSYISDDSNLTNILNTAQLSNTLPFELNSSQSSNSTTRNLVSNTRRESNSSCDTFVTCEDGDPNRTISDEHINMSSTSKSRTTPQLSSQGDSSINNTSEHYIEGSKTSKPKRTKFNVGDLSDRLQSFKFESPKRGRRNRREMMDHDEKLVRITDGVTNRKQYESSSEPSLISVSTPNDKNISPNTRKLSITSSVLDKRFCGDRRPSLDSMFSNITVKEYVYRDVERGITLIERHVSSECGNSTTGRLSLDSVTSARSIDSQKTEEYDWKSYVKTKPDLKQSETDSDVETIQLSQQFNSMSNEEIRQRLLSYGEDPGPVIAATRQTYLIRLASITSNPGLIQLSKHGPDYSVELRNAMEGKFDDVGLQDLEIKMIDLFNNSNGRKWREGALKSSFNYLLLDPRVTKNLPLRAKNMADGDVFCTFVAAIFYIGKGKRSRPYTHLYEAITQLQKPKPNVSNKVQQILDIWYEQQGVVSLHIFQNVIPVEAYTREACMIQAFSLDKLTNKKKGDFYGTSSTWSMKVKRRMGVYFLKKALQIFLAEGERQICPPDIKMGQ